MRNNTGTWVWRQFRSNFSDGPPGSSQACFSLDLPVLRRKLGFIFSMWCVSWQANGRLVSSGSIMHSYPFCWRSETPLLYKAVPSWWVRSGLSVIWQWTFNLIVSCGKLSKGWNDSCSCLGLQSKVLSSFRCLIFAVDVTICRFVAVEKFKDRLLVNNQQTYWVPDHVKVHIRVEDWILSEQVNRLEIPKGIA